MYKRQIYGLAYTNALRTVVMVFVHILGLILFAISQQKYVADIAYLVTMFSQYYAVFICAQLMRRYVGCLLYTSLTPATLAASSS